MPLLTVRGASGPPVAYRFDGDVVTIGRAISNHLVVRDPSLSRLHAELRHEHGAWRLVDRGSRNGVRLNGTLLRDRALLSVGDEILIGQTVLVFEVSVPGAVSEREAEAEASATLTARGTGSPDALPLLVGASAAMSELRATIRRVATTDAPVLILGENGTGKELAAQLIHQVSHRNDGPFIVVNCPALTSSLVEAELFGVEKGVATDVQARVGRLELAAGGTLLLDEIGDLEPGVQAKLLRFLQTRTFERVGGRTALVLDVRILAATNQDLAAAIESGRFRRDLYYRLNVVSLSLPPLRERREDLPELVAHFISQSGRPELVLGDEAMRALRVHSFPGNVRELEHAIQRAAIFCDGGVIRPEHLPADMQASAETDPGTAAAMLARIVEDGESFWTVVRDTYLRREIDRSHVESMLDLARLRVGPRRSNVARLLGLQDEYRRFVDFLRHHDLDRDRRP